jgi:hypothetical protein
MFRQCCILNKTTSWTMLSLEWKIFVDNAKFKLKNIIDNARLSIKTLCSNAEF